VGRLAAYDRTVAADAFERESALHPTAVRISITQVALMERGRLQEATRRPRKR
jgi:hypothetical protein